MDGDVQKDISRDAQASFLLWWTGRLGLKPAAQVAENDEPIYKTKEENAAAERDER